MHALAKAEESGPPSHFRRYEASTFTYGQGPRASAPYAPLLGLFRFSNCVSPFSAAVQSHMSCATNEVLARAASRRHDAEEQMHGMADCLMLAHNAAVRSIESSAVSVPYKSVTLSSFPPFLSLHPRPYKYSTISKAVHSIWGSLVSLPLVILSLGIHHHDLHSQPSGPLDLGRKRRCHSRSH